MAIGPVIVYKQHSRLFFLKHLDFSSFFFEPFLSSSLTLSSSSPSLPFVSSSVDSPSSSDFSSRQPFLLASAPQRLEKKKYLINSFLFNSLCHFSRKRSVRFFDTDVLRTYFTLPYRLSLTRFLTYRILFRYCSSSSLRFFSSLRKHLFSRAFRSSFLSVLRLKHEFVKNFLFSLASRLDSSLFRLFHFWPSSTLKRSPFDPSRSRPIFRHIKSPWKNFTVLQAKQQLTHGHFFLNGKKVTSGNIKLTLFDTLSLTSFLSNPFWFGSSFFFSQLLRCSSSFHCLFLFRHLKSLSPDFSFWRFFFHSPNLSEVSFLCQHLKTFHIKRFTEIFFLSYKNFHLFSRVSSSSPSFLETLLKPFVSSLSHYQSIFFFWPLLPLLSFVSWGPSLQRTILRPSSFDSRSSSRDLLHKNLHDLFILKKLQTQLFSSFGQSPLPVVSSSSSSSDPVPSPEGHNLLSHFLFFSTLHPSLFSVKSLFCYASILYGTRKCKWVHLQQRKPSFFFNRFYDKTHFFELELDFFQLSFRLS